jgi:hypothetical protein
MPEDYDVIKYCLDPKDCLKALKDDRDDQNMPQKLNTDAMTKLRDNGNWDAWRELFSPENIASHFWKKGDQNVRNG